MYGIVDCDNCYVSCERVFRPDLNGKPVVVLSNNDKCVVARSNEAKKMGIKTAYGFAQHNGDWVRVTFRNIVIYRTWQELNGIDCIPNVITLWEFFAVYEQGIEGVGAVGTVFKEVFFCFGQFLPALFLLKLSRSRVTQAD